jgi:hypothetical protein
VLRPRLLLLLEQLLQRQLLRKTALDSGIS